MAQNEHPEASSASVPPSPESVEDTGTGTEPGLGSQDPQPPDVSTSETSGPEPDKYDNVPPATVESAETASPPSPPRPTPPGGLPLGVVAKPSSTGQQPEPDKYDNVPPATVEPIEDAQAQDSSQTDPVPSRQKHISPAERAKSDAKKSGNRRFWRPKSTRGWIITVSVVILLAVGGFLSWKFFLSDSGDSGGSDGDSSAEVPVAAADDSVSFCQDGQVVNIKDVATLQFGDKLSETINPLWSGEATTDTDAQTVLNGAVTELFDTVGDGCTPEGAAYWRLVRSGSIDVDAERFGGDNLDSTTRIAIYREDEATTTAVALEVVNQLSNCSDAQFVVLTEEETPEIYVAAYAVDYNNVVFVHTPLLAFDELDDGSQGLKVIRCSFGKVEGVSGDYANEILISPTLRAIVYLDNPAGERVIDIVPGEGQAGSAEDSEDTEEESEEGEAEENEEESGDDSQAGLAEEESGALEGESAEAGQEETGSDKDSASDDEQPAAGDQKETASTGDNSQTKKSEENQQKVGTEPVTEPEEPDSTTESTDDYEETKEESDKDTTEGTEESDDDTQKGSTDDEVEGQKPTDGSGDGCDGTCGDDNGKEGGDTDPDAGDSDGNGDDCTEGDCPGPGGDDCNGSDCPGDGDDDCEGDDCPGSDDGDGDDCDDGDCPGDGDDDCEGDDCPGDDDEKIKEACPVGWILDPFDNCKEPDPGPDGF